MMVTSEQISALMSKNGPVGKFRLLEFFSAVFLSVFFEKFDFLSVLVFCDEEKAFLNPS
jgi:hypothetical protein